MARVGLGAGARRLSRLLAWDGCVNVRDLGGLPVRGGSTIRNGAIVRSDNARRLTDAGWEALEAHGVRTVLDLRWDAERADDPPRDVTVDAVHLPLLGDDSVAYGRELDERLAGIDDYAQRTTAAYLDMLTTWRQRFVDAVRVVADAPPGGVLVHCAAGKDRTGLVVALLLALAGVDAGVIADDYAESEPALPELHRRWVGEARDESERAWRAAQRMQSTPREALVRVLAELGSVEEYLRGGGLTDVEMQRVRGRLVEAA
jgi:protein-tyrosine phosphatase